jgi:hypothetical protein
MAFHVPHRCRIRDGHLASEDSQGNTGAFLFDSLQSGWKLFTIADDGTNTFDPVHLRGWEHVSVQAIRGDHHGVKASRLPTWIEMCFVKERFWDDEDVVMQLHPRRSQYVNQHRNVLHLWRPRQQVIPEPPSQLVGTGGVPDTV